MSKLKSASSSPPSWKELQSRFAYSVIHAPHSGPVADFWSDGPGLSVHHNTVIHGQVDALAHVFPVFQQLVGEECFFAVIKDFFRSFPPSSPCLEEHGACLADFVQDLPFLQSMPWLLDMIHLEWALYVALHAAKDDGCDLRALISRPPSELDSLVFKFHSSVSFLSSSWPVNAIRVAHQTVDKAPDFSGISLDSGPESMVIFRDTNGTQVMLLDGNAFLFLNNCYLGLTLAGAAEDVLASGVEVALADCLTLALRQRWIVGVENSRGI